MKVNPLFQTTIRIKDGTYLTYLRDEYGKHRWIDMTYSIDWMNPKLSNVLQLRAHPVANLEISGLPQTCYKFLSQKFFIRRLNKDVKFNSLKKKGYLPIKCTHKKKSLKNCKEKIILEKFWKTFRIFFLFF